MQVALASRDSTALHRACASPKKKVCPLPASKAQKASQPPHHRAPCSSTKPSFKSKSDPAALQSPMARSKREPMAPWHCKRYPGPWEQRRARSKDRSSAPLGGLT
jgi:hypothetical protein